MNKTREIIIGIFMFFLLFGGVSSQITGAAISVDAEYVTMYAGDQEGITFEIENNEKYDLEEVSVSLNLEGLPFTTVGSSEKDVDDIRDEDSEKVTFTLRASTEITPGDYSIPYVVYYTPEDKNESQEKTGSFGLRVSSKTDIDFTSEVSDNIVGQQGKVSLRIDNKGLGEIKAISVQIFPGGAFELLSAEKVYVGELSSDDFDFATFDVIFKQKDPTFSAKIEYKDFENNKQTETVNIPIQVYTSEEALNLGLIQKNNSLTYITIIIVLIIVWLVYKTIKKRRKKKNKG